MYNKKKNCQVFYVSLFDNQTFYGNYEEMIAFLINKFHHVYEYWNCILSETKIWED